MAGYQGENFDVLLSHGLPAIWSFTEALLCPQLIIGYKNYQ